MRQFYAIAALLALLALSACALPLNYQASRHDLTLAKDRSAPELALLEHRLYREFTVGDGERTICAARRMSDGGVEALTANQEERLILRFPRLAPFERCTLVDDLYRDVEAGRPAALIDYTPLVCENATHCFGSSGWRPGRAPYAGTDYELTYRGYWQVREDMDPIILTGAEG